MPEEKYWEPKIADYLFSSNGRIGRSEFFISFLAQAVGFSVLLVLFGYPDLVTYAHYAILLASAYVIVVLAAKRCHDMNYAGPVALIILVPIVNLLFLLFLLFRKGSKGTNDFGPPSFQSFITPDIYKSCPECAVKYGLFDFVTQPDMCAKCWRERKRKSIQQSSNRLG